MAQNCRGFGREALRAAGGGLAGDGRSSRLVTAPGRQPTFTHSSTCVGPARPAHPLGLTGSNCGFGINRRNFPGGD